MDVYYALQVGEQYRCGGCSFLTTDVKALHFHVRQHTICGSYFFCNDTKTAFPHNKKLQATTQTELLVEITSDDIIRTGNSLRFIPEVEKSKSSRSKTPKRQNQKKAPESKNVPDVSDYIQNDYTDDYEPVDDYADLETATQTSIQPSAQVSVQTNTKNPLVEIPLSYKTMSNAELLDILLNEIPDETNRKQADQNYIVVQGGQKGSSTFDDGVRWNSFSRKSSKQLFTVDSEMKLSRIYMKGTMYCTMRLEKKRKIFDIMEPQPTTVLAFQKVFISLEGNNSYKRRITYIAEAPDSLADAMDKSVVEYYMDITNVRKETSCDTQVNVTLPDCSKLKEMLYPGLSKEIPEYVKEDANSNENKKSGGNVDVSEDIPDPEPDEGEMDQNEVKQSPKVTAFQFMSSDEIVKVLMTEDESNDVNKHYRVFSTTRKGFNKIDVYGVWDVSSTKNIQFVQTENREFKQVMKRNGQYCIHNKAAGNEYIELTPQPKTEDLLVLNRCTFFLYNSKMIKKRETVVSFVPNNGFLGLKNKHVVEYISEKMAIPIHVEKENGQKSMLVQHHKLLPCGPEFQEKFQTSKEMGFFSDLQVKNGNNYFANEEILEKLIVEDINTKSPENSGRNYMVIQNEKADGKRKFYLKDGCIWNGKEGTSTNQTFVINEHNQLRGVMKRNGLWCVKKLEKKQRFYSPIEPQPGPDDLITFHKYFTSLKSCPLYKKRITTITLAPERLEFIKYKLLVEYYSESSKRVSFKDMKELCSKESRKDETASEIGNTGSTSLKRKFDDSIDGAEELEEVCSQDETDKFTEDSGSIVQEESKSTDLVVSGSAELPVTDMFRTSQECWKIFTTDTPVGSVMCNTHMKDYVFVQCEESEGSVNSSVYQDGLIWDTCGLANSRQTYLLEFGKIGRSVVKKNGVLCFAKQDKHKQVYEPVVQQSRDVVTFYRTWVKLKGSNRVKKRVTNITEAPTKYSLAKSRALIEYFVDEPPQEESNVNKTGNSVYEKIKEIQTGTSTAPQPYIKMANMEDDFDLDTDEIESESEDEMPTKSKSVYKKPIYTPPDVDRTFRSPRLQERSLKKIKIEPEDNNDTPNSESSVVKMDNRKAKTPKKSETTNIKPSHGKFGFPKTSDTMNSELIFNLLLTEEGLNCLKDRPAGAYYVIVNVEWYGDERRRKLQDNFSWESSTGSTQNSFYEVNPDYTLTYLVQKNGKYHKKKRENNRIVYELLEPQPKEVIKVHRYWVKGKAMPDLGKRVTVITEAPERLADVMSRVLVEYSWC